MKHFLFLFFLFDLISSVKADSLCTLTSEVEPDVTITLKYTGSGGGIGTLNYKNKPSFGLYVRHLEWIWWSVLHGKIIFT